MNLERAASYLAAGCTGAQVANIMGCSPGYIVQLMGKEEFKVLVERKKAENGGEVEKEEQDIQRKYLGLEHQLIKAMGDALPNAELPAITRALEVVATRQEKAAVRKLPAGHPAHGGNRVGNMVVVQLSIPGHAIPEMKPVIQVNEKNEVVAIDSKPMAPMSSSAVEKMFKSKKAAENAVLLEGSVEEAAVLADALKEL